MQEAVGFFVEHGSYALMTGALVAAGLGLPLPEDIVMISGAILAQRHITDLRLTVVALVLGVFLGDSALFLVARRVGPAIYRWRWIARVLPQARREWIEAKIARYGGLVVFAARHVAGLRGPTFAIAAIHGISYPRFIAWDLLALTISLPVWMAMGWFFSDSLDQLASHTATAEEAFSLGAIALVLLVVAAHAVTGLLRRRAAKKAAAAGADSAAEPDPR